MKNFFRRIAENSLLFFLVAIVLINTIQFRSIEEGTNANYRALNLYETGDIVEIGLRASNTIRQYYISQFALGKVAPKATIMIPENYSLYSSNYSARLYGFGQAAEVNTIETIEMDDIDLDALNIDQHIVAFGEDSRTGRRNESYPFFAIAMDHDIEENKFQPLGSAIIQTSKTTPIREGAEFIVLEWEGPIEPFRKNLERSEPYFYTLFLETSLLPADVKSELSI